MRIFLLTSLLVLSGCVHTPRAVAIGSGVSTGSVPAQGEPVTAATVGTTAARVDEAAAIAVSSRKK